MIRAFAFGAWLLLPGAALAQELRVVSGNHSDFARLVVLSSPVPEWTAMRVDGGYALTLAAQVDFDVEDVFELIPRDRIGAVEDRGDGELFLRVECDCHLDAFEVNAGLVLDIRDGDAPADSPFERMRAGAAASRPALTGEVVDERSVDDLLSDLFFRQGVRADRFLDPWQGERVAVAPTRPPLRVPTGLGAAPFPGIGQPTERMDDRIDALRSLLITEFSRASVQGLIDVAVLPEAERDVDASTEETPPPVELAPVLPSEDTLAADIFASMLDHMRLQTALDRALPSPRDKAPDGADVTCYPDGYFNVASWGANSEPDALFSIDRSAILGEFDRVDVGALLALARLYIHYSFGAEAIALIESFGTPSTATNALLDLAQIIDDRPSEMTLLTPGHVACQSRIALWSILAHDDVSQFGEVARDAILLAFSELPPHLRNHLSPVLSQRFLALGDEAAATNVLQAVSRNPDVDTDAAAFVQSEISARSGDPDDALEGFENVLRNDGPLAGAAGARLVDESLNTGTAVAPEILQAVEAMTGEHRGTPAGSDLVRATIRANAHAGNFTVAMAALSESVEQGEISSAQAAVLSSEILGLAADVASDVEMIAIAVSPHFNLAELQRNEGASHTFATRFAALGLMAQADEILGTLDPEERSLILAGGLLDDGLPSAALDALAEFSGARAVRLRASAYEALGQTDAAAAILAALGEDDELPAVLFGGETPFADPRRLDDTLPPGNMGPEPVGGVGVLASHRSAIGQSRDARAEIAEMLGAPENP